MHKKFQVAIFVLALVVSGCMNQEEEKPKEETDLEKLLSVQYYTIHVIPSLSDHTMEVEAEIMLQISEPVNQVTFCLNPEFSVSRITDETGASLTFEREYDLVTVDIPDLKGAAQKRVTFVYDGMVYQRSAETTWDYVGEEGLWVRTQYNWYPVIPGAAEAVIIKTVLMIFALEEKVGDEPFFEALRALLAKYKGVSITTEAFQEELEYASGEELDQFFEQYYYGKEIPPVEC